MRRLNRDEGETWLYRPPVSVLPPYEEKDIILIGWATEVEKRVNGEVVLSSRGEPIYEKEIIINPRSSTNSNYSKKHKFKKGDSLFIISYEKPGLKKYFNGGLPIESEK